MESEELNYDNLRLTAEFILSKTKHRPKIAIICGSGLGELAELAEETDVIPYSEIPRFPVSSVEGHKGNLVFGLLSGKVVVFMQGRIHPFEGHSFLKCGMPVRVFKLLGVNTLIVTNAAGGLNTEYKKGDMMIIKDHISMPGLSSQSPLRGPNDERWGPRFPGMNRSYDSTLRSLAHQVGEELGYGDILREGVYSMVTGPCFETPAECRYLALIGADVVGMSTTHEVALAVHCGLRVFGMTLVTDMAALDYSDDFMTNHEDVLAVSKQRSTLMQKFIATLVGRMQDPPAPAAPAAPATHH